MLSEFAKSAGKVHFYACLYVGVFGPRVRPKRPAHKEIEAKEKVTDKDSESNRETECG